MGKRKSSKRNMRMKKVSKFINGIKKQDETTWEHS